MLYLLYEMVKKSYAAITQCSQTNYNKFKRRMFRTRTRTVTMLVVIQTLMSNNSIISQISIVQFMITCCFFRLALKNLEAPILGLLACCFVATNSYFLWWHLVDLEILKLIFAAFLLVVLALLYHGMYLKIGKY